MLAICVYTLPTFNNTFNLAVKVLSVGESGDVPSSSLFLSAKVHNVYPNVESQSFGENLAFLLIIAFLSKSFLLKWDGFLSHLHHESNQFFK